MSGMGRGGKQYPALAVVESKMTRELFWKIECAVTSNYAITQRVGTRCQS